MVGNVVEGPHWEQEAPGPDAPAYTPPPSVVEVEQHLLATLLRRNAAYDVVSDMLRPEHFFDDLHGRIYEAVARNIAEGKEAGAAAIAPLFEGQEERKGHSVSQYLRDLEANPVTLVNGRQYAEIIVDRAERRRLRDVSISLWDYVHDDDKLDVPAAAIAEELSNVLTDVQIGEAGGLPDDLPVIMGRTMTAIEAAMNADGSVTGVPTGLGPLDARLSGLQDSDLIVLGARPGMGKTAMGLTIARNAARAGYGAGFFSLEQSEEQVGQRLLAMDTGISVEEQRNGQLSQGEFERLHQAGLDLGQLPLYIDDRAMSLQRIRSTARWWQRRRGLDLIVIDYLGLLDSHTRENSYERTSRLTREAKLLAKQLNIPVVLLSQLNRGVEHREDKRPMLADLRESGTIEQDADVIGFVYREYEYLKSSEPIQKSGEGEEKFHERHTAWEDRLTRTMHVGDLLLRKNRHGQTGDMALAWNGRRGLFSDLDKREEGML